MFAHINNIDHLIKYASEVDQLKNEVSKKYDSLVDKILEIEHNYINNLKPQEIGKIGDVSIFLVDGDVIEKTTDMDFVEGGHDLVYNFIPDKTIWIDVSMDTDTFKYLILHEYIERSIMEKVNFKYGYDTLRLKICNQRYCNLASKVKENDWSVGPKIFINGYSKEGMIGQSLNNIVGHRIFLGWFEQ